MYALQSSVARFLQFTTLLVLTTGATFAAEKPNVVVILVDDQGCFATTTLGIFHKTSIFQAIFSNFKLQPSDPN